MSESVEIEMLIPAPLRIYVNNQKIVKIKASNIKESIKKLTDDFVELKNHIFDENGQIRNFVNIYVGDEDIRFLKAKENTSLRKGEKVSIVPSIAGG
ncbi:MAG: MoaD/ThiS family protein [Candidatus Hodarchaeales archaeon]|jgi:molybdopterin converting factor small subunit